MSIQPNSARLFKYSRMNSSGRRTSMSEYEPKETFKLASIRSITKGIKHNDLSFITGVNLNKLRVEQTQPENLQYVTSHDTLASIRKKHDQIKRNRVKRESDLESMKEQFAKLKEQERQYVMKKTNASEFSKELEKNVVDKKLSLEEAMFESKSLTNIIHRIKHDRVTYDQRKYNMEKQLEFLKKKLNIVKRQEHSVGENSDRTRKVYEKLTKQLQIQNRERMEHLANIEQSIQVKQDMREVTNAREGQIADIAERAMQDKDQNQKNWKKLLGVHKFVSVMLREKMERQMNKFKIVETAFKNIKIATGTADTVELVDKFLNKETVYGELLSKIAESERKIDSLKHQHEGLEKQCKQIEEQMNLFEITKKGNQDLSKEFKQLESYEDKSKRSELLSQKFFQWVLKQLRKIYKQQGGKIKSLKYGNNQVKEALEELFVWLETNSLSADETFNADIHPNSVNSSEMDNLMRVKVKKDEDQDGDELETTVNEEDQYVSGARNDLIRQNDKFMKELKKKAEALMKLRIEMAPKKKEKQQIPNQMAAEKLEE